MFSIIPSHKKNYFALIRECSGCKVIFIRHCRGRDYPLLGFLRPLLNIHFTVKCLDFSLKRVLTKTCRIPTALTAFPMQQEK